MHICVQVPNDLLVEVKGTVGGCSAICISRDGRWLAAACGDDKGRFKVSYVALMVCHSGAWHAKTRQAIGT